MRWRFWIMFLLLLVIGESGASAQNLPQTNLKKLSLEELMDIQVTTPSKEPEQISSIPAAIYVITQEEIRRSGVTSIPDALRLAPGIEVGRISSTTWAIGSRGFQGDFSKSLLVLIDGRSVYSPLEGGVFWDVQDVVLEDIDRIEVIRGPGGTIWGANAVNGVINIVTKSAADTHGILSSVTGGRLDRAIGATHYGGGNGAGFDYRVFAKGFLREAEFHPDGDNFDRWHQERTGLRLDWKRGNDTFDLNGSLYRGDSPHRAASADVRDIVDGGDLLGRWRRVTSNRSDLYFQTYFDRTIRSGAIFGENRNTIDLDFLHHFKADAHDEFSWGGGLRWSPNRFLPKTTLLDVVPHDETDHDYSAFAQDEFHFNDKLSLTLGSKFQHNNFSGFDIQPSVRLLWTRPEHQSLWAAVTRSIVTPSRIEEGFRLSAQIGANPPAFILVSGNPNFRAESVVSYEIGYRRFLTSALYLDVTPFSSHYRRLQSFGAPVVSLETTPPPPHILITTPYQNSIAGSANGFEIAPVLQAASWWRLAGSYSFVAIDVHANGPTSDISATGSVRTYEGSTPRHHLEVHSFINLSKKFEFDQMVRYASALPAQNVKPYETADLRLGWNPRSNIQISLFGGNLFQPHHPEWGTGDPTQTPLEVRRTAYIKLTLMQ